MSTIKADLDEIVFRTRNKGYGAYQLRRDHGRNFMLAFLFSGAFVLLVMGMPVLRSMIFGDGNNEEEVIVDSEIVLEEFDIDNEEEMPEEINVPPPPPPRREEIRFVPPEVVEDDEAPDETILDTEDLLEDDEQNVGDEDVEGDDDADLLENVDNLDLGDGDGDDVPVPTNTRPDPNAYVVTDNQPKPVNMDQVPRVYPEVARAANIEGKVFLKILIDEQGNPLDHIVLKSPHPSLTQSAVDAAKQLRFTPAIQAGNPIKFWIVVPFDYSL